jgi:hypothetical protein
MLLQLRSLAAMQPQQALQQQHSYNWHWQQQLPGQQQQPLDSR